MKQKIEATFCYDAWGKEIVPKTPAYLMWQDSLAKYLGEKLIQKEYVQKWNYYIFRASFLDLINVFSK